MRLHLLFIGLIGLSLNCCNNDPEPGPSPEEDRAYITLYNFLSEPYEVEWEVDEVEIQDKHPYGTFISGGVLLDKDSEEILIVVKKGDSGANLESELIQMTKDKNYLAVVYGTAENPILFTEELETTLPPSGQIHSRFLHAHVDGDSLDIYMGGTTPEKQILSGLYYGAISAYEEVSEYDARASVIVAIHDSVFKEENKLIAFEYNDLIQVNTNYLTVIAPESNLDPSDLTLWLYPQPRD